jgi:lysophospholipase L1-like esterase
MKKTMITTLTITLVALGLGAQLTAGEPQLEPNRLSSTGDSITEAIDAELPLANHWASWSNGYTNFWTWLFGLSNVRSHNQRISFFFGNADRANFMEAVSGADSADFAGQTLQSVDHQATYVTVLMGHNDVCANDFADIPTDAEFEANMRAGFENLKNGLPPGATVYVLGIVDIIKLWELGDELTALGFLDCELLWATTLIDLFPCGTMLSPLNTPADREFTRSRNIAFNQILEALVAEYSANDPLHYYVYNDIVFDTDFTSDDVSWLDCFHPSADGQRKLAARTWAVGPFAGP